LICRANITAPIRESERGLVRRENESPRFDSDAFSALTVIGRVGRPDDDTGSLWHCDSPFAEQRARFYPPLSLSLSLFPSHTRNSEFRSSPARIRLARARESHMRDIWRVTWPAGAEGRGWTRGPVDTGRYFGGVGCTRIAHGY